MIKVYYISRYCNVTVSKNVDGLAADNRKDFSFSYKIDDGEEKAFSLRHGESNSENPIEIEKGKSLSIKETSSDGFSVTVMLGETPLTAVDGWYTIDSVTEDVSISFTNTRSLQTIKVYKYETGNEGKALENAEFSLRGSAGTEYSFSGIKTNMDGYLVFGEDEVAVELPLGSYVLTETTPPHGYNPIAQEMTFSVAANGVTGVGSGFSIIAETVTVDDEEVPTGVYVIKVANSAGVELPSTGDSGTIRYTISGIALITVSTAAYCLRKRRREREI